jgi:hypothetical protein
MGLVQGGKFATRFSFPQNLFLKTFGPPMPWLMFSYPAGKSAFNRIVDWNRRENISAYPD